MPDYQRVSRVGEAMKAEIADILIKKVKDPRIGFATITGITITRDFRHAWISVTILEGRTTEHESLLGLERASGFIRSELGRRLRLRRIPTLTFQRDDHGAQTRQVLTILETLEAPNKSLNAAALQKSIDDSTSTS